MVLSSMAVPDGTVPCGHTENTNWLLTSDSGLAFCTRCQRGYEFAAPSSEAAANDQRFLREALAFTLLL